MSEIALIGPARQLRPAHEGASWLLPFSSDPGQLWVAAFGRHQWTGPLGLRLQPPVVISVDDTTGIGLRAGHLDGTIAPYRQIEASIHAAVELANHVVSGKVPIPSARPMTERHLRELLRRNTRQVPPPPTSQS